MKVRTAQRPQSVLIAPPPARPQNLLIRHRFRKKGYHEAEAVAVSNPSCMGERGEGGEEEDGLDLVAVF